MRDLVYADVLFDDQAPPPARIRALVAQLSNMAAGGELIAAADDAARLFDQIVLRLLNVADDLRGEIVSLRPPAAVLWGGRS